MHISFAEFTWFAQRVYVVGILRYKVNNPTYLQSSLGLHSVCMHSELRAKSP